MKHQQVVVDYWTMFKTSGLCILLAISGFIFLKMVQTIFWLPNHLKRNQERLEAIAKQYGKDMDEDERAEIEKIFNSDGPLTEEKLNKLLENTKDEPKKEQ
ncbi:hypothetical protein KR215_003359 [Drosophila sulfurigaster]|uniref:Uncharacterized protein LOC117575180 n=1 Tax=Drosophila albomicans TaxID=7291 RepID=A0A6P8XV30_DROAB|nr:uncharacterized protein LOC117575180 [Drosophila albomicans]XP_060648289.1 uncharacterized protein LOC132785965 [Drosophila nasuta]XP_062125890.1 uncharacterized protein LOC133838714 [Drosophila sulfurigaster albostrigata]KAH8399160.1 hypothetical protein KR215_003359 [Drosophila sulfurigaster]